MKDLQNDKSQVSLLYKRLKNKRKGVDGKTFDY